MIDKPVFKDISDKLNGQRETLKGFVKSAAGRQAVEYLTIKYAGDVQVKGDPYATHVRIGERNVIDYLIELQKEDGKR